MNQILRATNFAAEKHSQQRRNNSAAKLVTLATSAGPSPLHFGSTHDCQIYPVRHVTDRTLCLVLQTRLDHPWPNLPTPFITVGSIPVRQPASLPVDSLPKGRRHFAPAQAAIAGLPLPSAKVPISRLSIAAASGSLPHVVRLADLWLVMEFVCNTRYIGYKHHQLATGHARHTTRRWRSTSLRCAS